MQQILARDFDKKTADRLIWLMFFGSVIGRVLMADFPKYLFVYPDEANFVMIAQSIASGKGLSVYNGVTIYQKIFYSLCIAPAFLSDNPVVVSRLIMLINSTIMSLGVFPAYLLSGRILKKNVLNLCMGVFYLISADMTYTITFMSEVLFLPMAITVLCLYYDFALNIRQDASRIGHIMINALMGLMVGVLYYIKEVALVFLAGYAAFIILTGFYELVLKKEDRKIIRQTFLLQLLGLGIQVAAFFALNTFMQQVIFQGVHGSYQLYSLSILAQPGYFPYFIFAMAYYLMNLLMSFLLLPVVLPVLKFDRLSKPVQRLLLFLLLLMMGTTVIVGFMISLREDFPNENPRAHVRYLGYLLVPLITILVHLGEQEKKQEGSLRSALDVLVMGGVTLLFYRYYLGAKDISAVDDNLLNYVDIDTITEAPIYHLWIFVGLVFVIGYLLYRFRPKWMLYSFFLLFIAIQVINNYKSTMEYRRYGLHDDIIEAVRILEDFENAHPNDKFLILNGGQDMFVRARDTYDRSANHFVLAAGYVYLDQEDGLTVDLNDTDSLAHLLYPAVPYGYYSIGEVDYIVTSNDFYLSEVEETAECAKINGSQKEFTVYDVGGTSIVPKVHVVALEEGQ